MSETGEYLKNCYSEGKMMVDRKNSDTTVYFQTNPYSYHMMITEVYIPSNNVIEMLSTGPREDGGMCNITQLEAMMLSCGHYSRECPGFKAFH